MKRLISLLIALIMVFTSVSALAYEELSKGSSGKEVVALQERLKELGYYTISVDGDYGNGTKNAVAGFQSRNGIDTTGVATIETQNVLFSDNAKAVPSVPDIEVVKVKKNGNVVSATFKNNMNQDVVSVEFIVITYTNDGRISSESNGNMQTAINGNDIVFGRFRFADGNIKAGGNKTIEDNYSRGDDYNYNYNLAAHSVVGIGVESYTLASGEKHIYSYEQMTFLKSDGSIIYPPDESTDFRILTADEEAKTNSIMFGIVGIPIPYYLSDYFQLPTGLYIKSVDSESIAEKAGIRKGDVLVSFNEDDATKPYASEYAKLKMLEDNNITVTYWRNNKLYETTFTLNSNCEEE